MSSWSCTDTTACTHARLTESSRSQACAALVFMSPQGHIICPPTICSDRDHHVSCCLSGVVEGGDASSKHHTR